MKTKSFFFTNLKHVIGEPVDVLIKFKTKKGKQLFLDEFALEFLDYDVSKLTDTVIHVSATCIDLERSPYRKYEYTFLYTK